MAEDMLALRQAMGTTVVDVPCEVARQFALQL